MNQSFEKSRSPTCSRCQNHNTISQTRAHRGKCPFSSCKCNLCEATKQRQRILSEHIRKYRKTRAEQNRNSRNSGTLRGRLNREDKLTEQLFKVMQVNIKNVIKSFIQKSSGNARFLVQNWIDHGIEMASNPQNFSQTSQLYEESSSNSIKSNMSEISIFNDNGYIYPFENIGTENIQTTNNVQQIDEISLTIQRIAECFESNKISEPRKTKECSTHKIQENYEKFDENSENIEINLETCNASANLVPKVNLHIYQNNDNMNLKQQLSLNGSSVINSPKYYLDTYQNTPKYSSNLTENAQDSSNAKNTLLEFLEFYDRQHLFNRQQLTDDNIIDEILDFEMDFGSC